MNVAGKQIDVTTLGIFGFIVLIVAYYLGTRTGKAKGIQTDPNSAVNVAGNLAAELKRNPLSYDLPTYNALADRCYIAVYGVTEDEESFYTVMKKMRNNSDILQLIAAFGKRSGGFDFWNDKTLSEWIYTDLNSVEINKVNDILSYNGLTFRF